MESRYKVKGTNKELKIFRDEMPESPREWDNLGTMLCFHKRYNLGDKHEINYSAFSNWQEVEKYLINELKACVILPLYLYDHSGITMKTTPFGCRFDSGQVGFIYATKDDIKKNFEIKNVTKKYIEKTKKILELDVELYSNYIEGEVYSFEIIEKSVCDKCKSIHEETLDSCSGFYGYDFNKNGLFDHAGVEENQLEEIF